MPYSMRYWSGNVKIFFSLNLITVLINSFKLHSTVYTVLLRWVSKYNLQKHNAIKSLMKKKYLMKIVYDFNFTYLFKDILIV